MLYPLSYQGKARTSPPQDANTTSLSSPRRSRAEPTISGQAALWPLIEALIPISGGQVMCGPCPFAGHVPLRYGRNRPASVETRGLEPLTFCLQNRCSPN